jgi:hypothetical protein
MYLLIAILKEKTETGAFTLHFIIINKFYFFIKVTINKLFINSIYRQTGSDNSNQLSI